ncbi:sulfotransferase domain-containing protein [Winogradskyella echinorum]|uniref:Sulfotransferase domain-containing protein n=1 Tax=Winogradskyella echinorum TaxID=538189 RepID=A0ABR6Y3X4_9FLAO|nr:sulfotransferase domain-containing protein [Winogradskyella echinorum]MBC3846950.1 sulfotransferase domain-containing protein [Winogradskyella echinorum]MBC5751298.1 sulfotransferase domain-containing protein [Winogradskyella echinorum]
MGKKPILISGIHRSGSTWVGKVVAKSKNVKYVSEPFNVAMKDYVPPFDEWYKYVSSNSEQQEQDVIKRYLDKRIYLNRDFILNRLQRMNSIQKLKYLVRDSFERLNKRSLLKDPIALFSAEWIFNQYNCDVVILIRHPAAFYLSIKEKDWTFNFENLAKQPLILDGPLKEFKDTIQNMCSTENSLIEQAVLIWNCIYTQVYNYQRKYSDKWHFLKHEDLSRKPLHEFEEMFNFLNLNFDSQVKSYILKTTTSNNDSLLERNSINNITKWQKKLTEDEISYIKKETESVWRLFYTNDDWLSTTK